MTESGKDFVVKADLADLLGSPHQTFTRQSLRGMVESEKTVVIRTEDGTPIGLGLVQEREDGHFELVATLSDKKLALDAPGRDAYSIGFKCDSPLHGGDIGA